MLNKCHCVDANDDISKTNHKILSSSSLKKIYYSEIVFPFFYCHGIWKAEKHHLKYVLVSGICEVTFKGT